jgi:hypothetical protein
MAEAVSVADWVKEQSTSFLFACSNDAAANIIMYVLRGMEIWARDNGREIDTVEIADIYWSHERLVVVFR